MKSFLPGRVACGPEQQDGCGRGSKDHQHGEREDRHEQSPDFQILSKNDMNEIQLIVKQ